MSTITVSSGSLTTTMILKRPRFTDLWSSYSEVGLKPAEEVYKLVGGEVLELYLGDRDSYANACALRMSRSFNYGGFIIPSGTIIKTYPIYRVKGSDNKAYILRVMEMIEYIKFNWGKPEYDIDPSEISVIYGKKGVIIIEVSGWRDASGHVTLWDGSSTGDGTNYQELSSYNGTVKPKRIMLWELKG